MRPRLCGKRIFNRSPYFEEGYIMAKTAEVYRFNNLPPTSQAAWSKLATLDTRSLVTYPFVIKTYDYQDSYAITDSTDLTAIIGTVSASVLAERTLSESYIDLVIASSTEAEASAAIAPYFE